MLLRVELNADVPTDVVAEALWGYGPGSILEGDGFLEAGFASADAAARVAASLPWPSSIEVVDDDTWRDAWRSHAGPVRVGRMLIVPSWLEAPAPLPDDIVVSIDPGTAFGSGSHPSTRLCVEALVELLPAGRVLDVGCGSGVLAITAGLLGASEVVAIDVASEAVEATRENAARNGVVVDARHAMIDDVDGTFDIVVANIGSATLRSIAPALARRVGSWLVLAGLLDGQEPEVVAAYASEGLELVDVRREDGWAAPRLRAITR